MLDKPNLEPNILHGYDTYNTIFTLSGIRESEIRDHTFLTNTPHDIIARTGGIVDANISDRSFAVNRQGGSPTVIKETSQRFGTKYDESIGILARSHDMFIENVNILSTVGPNNERNMANFTKMEFEVHEPFGITLIEKVRAATALNGFLDYQDAPLLLTIEFKGNFAGGMAGGVIQTRNTETGEFYGYIRRKIPILIARVDFDVNEGGAKYNVVAVPYTDMAFDDRFKFPRIDIPIAADDAFQWTREVKKNLDIQMDFEIKEKKRELKDEYVFKIDREVIVNGQNYKSEADTIHTTSTVSDYYDGSFGYFANNEPKQLKNHSMADSFTSLTKFFEDAVRQSFGYIDLVNNFWLGYLRTFRNDDGSQVYSGVSDKNPESIKKVLRSKEFADKIASQPYVPWFKIKATVQTDIDRFDNITKMHPKKIIYRAIPYRIHILKLMGAGMSVKADWSQYVKKEYNYLYTGSNLDVQGLRINYKSAYYMRNVREAKSATEVGTWADIKVTLQEVFGQERDPEPTLPLRQYPSILKGRNTADTTNPENTQAQEFYDYLTNPEADMMRIELDILGDPAYICQDIYMPVTDLDKDKRVGQKGYVYDKQYDSFNADQFMPCINLIYRLPDDIDEKEGTMFSGTQQFRDERLFFSGVYQVVKVESKFDQGQFLQTLICVRLNNQSGAGLPIDLINSAVNGSKDLDKNIKEKVKENLKTKVKTKVDDFFEDAAG